MFSKKWLFYRAVAKTRLKKAASLLEAGINPNLRFKGGNGQTALHLASFEGNVTERRVFQGKESNEADRFEMIKLLLEKGADVNARDNEGSAALHLASDDGCLRIVELLLEKGADVNARESSGNTALHYACLQKHSGEHVPYPHVIYWEKREHLEIARLLVSKGAGIKVRNNEGREALHAAAFAGGGLEIAEFLLEKGADVNARDDKGDTALHYACLHGHFEMARLLLEKGAAANARGSSGSSALHAAAVSADLHYTEVTEEDSLKIIKLLLEKGADANVWDNSGFSALHLASDCGHLQAARLLLEKGADASARDNDGNTALHYAGSGKDDRREIIKLLLEKGADAGVKNKKGETPLDIAGKRSHKKILQS